MQRPMPALLSCCPTDKRVNLHLQPSQRAIGPELPTNTMTAHPTRISGGYRLGSSSSTLLYAHAQTTER